ncbi:universal stress protein [Pontibacter sp. SGAir0037]|uniref:universal stress protein n=1 Tax=Pontibacter sp. SGAir0037 TaxID=2571030 RepID=UPI0010CCFA1C|nr:universal stress protein [Pontibacter sp. SGAir0037]QCR22559.1 hypothetical protein C1N53_09560 [Pontibacter sp. SGAir0037]
MKTLLVPVDFTDNALRSLEFAIEIARIANASVLTCHIYELSAVTPGLAEIVRKEFRLEEQAKMNSFLNRVDYKGVAVKTLLREGDTVSEICSIIAEKEIALVVMGTGGGKSLVKKVFGTTAQAIAKKGLCPVLVIPAKAEIKAIESIVYAADFENGDEVSTSQLLKLKELFQASLIFLHIESEKQPNYIDNEYIKANLQANFPNETFEFVEIKNRNVAQGIADYVQQHNTSLLAFTVLGKQLWERVLYGSVTSKLLQNLNIPMLALPENGIFLDLKKQNTAELEETV